MSGTPEQQGQGPEGPTGDSRVAGWEDNEAVQALSALAAALDGLSELTPARRQGVAPVDSATGQLPLQHLDAHAGLARRWEEYRPRVRDRFVARDCPVCAETRRTPWFDTQDGYQYTICDGCRMVYISSVLPIDEWNAYYKTLPEARNALVDQMNVSVSEASLVRDRERFGRYIDRLRTQGAAAAGSKLLDIGTFTGPCLRIAEERGLDAYGIEGIDEAVQFGRRHYPGLKLFQGSAEDFSAAELAPPYDVITLWETLEHTFDPVGVLQRAAALLRPGGWVAVTVPNAGNVQFTMLQPFCFYAIGGYLATGHVNMFSPRTLTAAFEKAGLKVRDVSTEFGTDWRQVLLFLQHEFSRIHCYRNYLSDHAFTESQQHRNSTILNWLSPTLTRLENACAAGPIILALAQKPA